MEHNRTVWIINGPWRQAAPVSDLEILFFSFLLFLHKTGWMDEENRVRRLFQIEGRDVGICFLKLAKDPGRTHKHTERHKIQSWFGIHQQPWREAEKKSWKSAKTSSLQDFWMDFSFFLSVSLPYSHKMVLITMQSYISVHNVCKTDSQSIGSALACDRITRIKYLKFHSDCGARTLFSVGWILNAPHPRGVCCHYVAKVESERESWKISCQLRFTFVDCLH